MDDDLHPKPTADQRAALDLLTSAKRVILTGHMRPDGDCIGAQAALYQLLTARGQEVQILNPDPPEEQFDYLSAKIPYGVDDGGGLPDHDLIVLLDCSEISRTGSLADRFQQSPASKLIIDHHILPPEPWWTESFHDHGASSTGLLIGRIASILGQELDTLAAHGVFTSMVTDTGWFKYSNTDAETLGLAAALVRRGVQPATLFGSIYQRRPADHPAAVGRLLSDVVFHSEGKLAVLALPLTEGGVPQSLDSDDALDLVRSVGEVEVVLFVRQVDPETCKLSARSKTTFNVNALARKFGGGGHVKASGATIEGSLVAVCAALVECVDSMWGSEVS